MTTATLIQDEPLLTPRRVVAAIIWAGACGTTALFLQSIGIDGIWLGILTIAIQSVATLLESRAWRGSPDIISIIAIICDVMINTTGIWQHIKLLPTTELWAMLVELGATNNPSITTLFLIGLIIGLLLAVAPEKVWE
jgi:hypothetical protein